MKKIKILIPVYNDWQSVFKLLDNINSAISNLSYEFSVLIVNDASTENRPEISFSVDENEDYEAVNTIFKYYKNTIPSLENIIDFVDKNPILLSKLMNKKNKKKIDKINVKFKTDL